MILTTGDKITIDTKDGPKYCAELRNSKGYTIHLIQNSMMEQKN